MTRSKKQPLEVTIKAGKDGPALDPQLQSADELVVAIGRKPEKGSLVMVYHLEKYNPKKPLTGEIFGTVVNFNRTIDKRDLWDCLEPVDLGGYSHD